MLRQDVEFRVLTGMCGERLRSGINLRRRVTIETATLTSHMLRVALFKLLCFYGDSELYDNHISGKMAYVPWLNLINLRSLDLYSNNLSWVIPGVLGKLSNLEFIKLNNNNLTGTVPQALADKFYQMNEVDLTNNPHLTGPCTDTPLWLPLRTEAFGLEEVQMVDLDFELALYVMEIGQEVHY
ncbi:leucine-rich receptor-like protein kinase family protein [Striga asiatica]|uniref:Leucine-rich receptor-like protein kinase family protein n=1 Tax=Striga asiatica TaxID=4170 RepID=A0A5A7QLL7_STRAF|nr:leucine-rich receptor-like protein kinase family protein [Striga asiatica]